MIFVNENNHRVILSARKCGLMSLMSTVPSMPNRLGHIYANKSFTVPFSIHRSLDPWVENTDIMANAGLEDSLREGYPTFDKSAWANYNIVLFIREPYERYISGLWTLWYIRWQGNTNWGSQGSPNVLWANDDERTLADFNKWYEDVLEQTKVYHLLNGHLRPFLHKTVGMEYKTLEVVNSKDLDGWLEKEGYPHRHLNPSNLTEKQHIQEYIKRNHKEGIMKMLEEEYEIYNKLNTF